MSQQAILQHFQEFPVSSRDQLLRRVYGGREAAIRKLNDKLKKLVLKGQLEVNVEIRPYVYFGVPRKVHKRSAHLNHHLAVVDFYLKLEDKARREGKPLRPLATEFSFGKGLPRPDLIIEWLGKVHMVELQRTTISNKKMQGKIREYEKLRTVGDHEYGSDWKLWIVGTRRYTIETSLPVVQTTMNM